MLFFNKLHVVTEDIDQLISNDEQIVEMRNNIKSGDVYIVKNVFKKQWIEDLQFFLKNVGQNSFPNYQKIEYGAPNFHRMNNIDERAYVKGCFHQFVFFPWNQDYFNVFEECSKTYQLKNLISGIDKDKYLGKEPEDGCIARIAVQFYPKGKGFLNRHCDPVDYHQLTIPILIMTDKGTDFKSGGAYVNSETGESICIDDQCSKGDVVFFNAQMPHGVDKIDHKSSAKWIDFEGRWMMLLAVNKLFDNDLIGNAKDLE